MVRPFGFEKPLGMRDHLPSQVDVKAYLRKQIMDEIQTWGYRRLETPVLEYYDTVGQATAIDEGQLFKLLDQEGKTLVLRPDMTAPIARIAASSLQKAAFPLRLAYDTNVFRAQRYEGGHPAEFEQIGIELLGDGSAGADAEVIALMTKVLKQASFGAPQVAVGHIGYINILLEEVVGREQDVDRLRRYLYEKNLVGFKQYVKGLSLSAADSDRLLGLLTLRGGRQILDDAEALIDSKQGKQTLADLTMLADVLEDYDVAQHVMFDFTLVSHMDYYTGIVYEGYNENLGFPLASGGRYDELLGQFQRPAPATGFGIFFDRLIEAEDKKVQEKASCCIIYTPDWRKEAFSLAQQKRDEGVPTVLQEKSGITDIETFKTRFSEVLYRLDGDREEAGG